MWGLPILLCGYGADWNMEEYRPDRWDAYGGLESQAVGKLYPVQSCHRKLRASHQDAYGVETF